MERMEYDPEGGNYLPVTARETGSTLIVVGIIMLLAALGWGLFVDWDIRAGNIMMRIIFGADVLIALGQFAPRMVQSARRAGLPTDRAYVVESAEAAVAAVTPLLTAQTQVLVKGSRGMRLERVVEQIREAR